MLCFLCSEDTNKIANESNCECDDVQVNLMSVLDAALKTVNNLSTELKKRDAEIERKLRVFQTKVQTLKTGTCISLLIVSLFEFD